MNLYVKQHLFFHPLKMKSNLQMDYYYNPLNNLNCLLKRYSLNCIDYELDIDLRERDDALVDLMVQKLRKYWRRIFEMHHSLYICSVVEFQWLDWIGE